MPPGRGSSSERLSSPALSSSARSSRGLDADLWVPADTFGDFIGWTQLSIRHTGGDICEVALIPEGADRTTRMHDFEPTDMRIDVPLADEVVEWTDFDPLDYWSRYAERAAE